MDDVIAHIAHMAAGQYGLLTLDQLRTTGVSRRALDTDVAFEVDSVRDADLAIAGWILIHVTWARLREDPAGVVRRVRQAIRRREGAAA